MSQLEDFLFSCENKNGIVITVEVICYRGGAFAAKFLIENLKILKANKKIYNDNGKLSEIEIEYQPTPQHRLIFIK